LIDTIPDDVRSSLPDASTVICGALIVIPLELMTTEPDGPFNEISEPKP
jgi:hypothetical protein